MHGDFSLNPLTYRDRVSRVLNQMGRVQLDSDANEQTEATLHFLRGLAQDVIGYHGGPDESFQIVPADPNKSMTDQLLIQWGEYYVDGIRCVNMPDLGFWDIMANPTVLTNLPKGLPISEHTDSYLTPNLRDAKVPQLVYLTVWERHISASENDSIREVALNGPDTASRAVVVWQIRIAPWDEILEAARRLRELLPFLKQPGGAQKPVAPKIDPVYLALNLRFRSLARLKAFAKENQQMEACTISPEARYRGSENRLFRVEVHQGGTPAHATFKWSEDNGAIVYPIREIKGKQVYLESLGRDERTAIRKNDWVEVVDDKVTLTRQVNPLLKVLDVDRHRMTVTLSAEPANNAGSDKKLNPILRRWAEEPRKIVENTDADLGESGVKVHFSHADAPVVYDDLKPSIDAYRTGDYWLIPARIALGNVIWPGGPDNPEALPPHGIDEHYAPLAVWDIGATPGGPTWEDRRWHYAQLATPAAP
jgi:hypothetical protein